MVHTFPKKKEDKNYILGAGVIIVMIKKIGFLVFILFLLSSLNSFAIQQEVFIDSEISHIDIYPRSAMLLKEGSLELDKGFYRIIFDDILEKFDEKTISAKLEETDDEIARITGVSIETAYLEEEPAASIRQLQDEINQLEKKIRMITSEKNSLKDKKEFLNSIIYFFQEQKTDGGLNIKIPPIDQLESIYTFLDEKLKINYEQVLNHDFQIESYQDKVVLLQKQLQQITSKQRETKKVITLDLEVYQKSSLSILLSYQLNEEISWQPIYDVRANIKKNSIELLTYALISQSTGMDWENVYISLSTARPTISGQLPSIESWFLRPYQLDDRVKKSMEMPMYRAESDMVAASSIGEGELLVPVEYKGTSVTFHVPKKVSIPSGTSREKALISEEKLAGQFSYKAFPKESPFVYFNVNIENKLDIPLLPGEVNIFIEGSFSGNSAISYIPPGEDFDVSLGIAENVKVQRELIKKFRDETLIAAIPSSKIATKYEYKIIVENFQDTESLCYIFENIPVSEDDRIKVNIDKISKEPELKDWHDKEGVWVWEFMLEPEEKNEISFIYSIVHPRDMQIIGLP